MIKWCLLVQRIKLLQTKQQQAENKNKQRERIIQLLEEVIFEKHTYNCKLSFVKLHEEMQAVQLYCNNDMDDNMEGKK